MSTRRARIKAVTALPPRRKNAENADANKTKPLPSKDSGEKRLMSPKTPRTSSSKPDERNSPAMTLLRSPPELLLLKPAANKPSPVSVGTPGQTIRANTPKSEKVTVITSASYKSLSSDVFVCPPVRNSPDIRASPRVSQSPKPKKRTTQERLGSGSDSSEKTSDSNKNEAHTNSSTPSKKTEIPYDFTYSIPSVPESATDEAMDGIVPLNPTHSADPLDLKNEIISEHAEVLFDPIVPLPSPSKVRPKLRPVPRLAPYRRNSIQGSASESEDESRRREMLGPATPATPVPPRLRHDSHTSLVTLLSAPQREPNRTRNDSVCSAVSQTTIPLPATSPIKEKHMSKTRRNEMSKRMWRRRRETVKRDALTMYDLIFYNPTTNPIIPDQDELQAKEANAKEVDNVKCQPTPAPAPAPAPVDNEEDDDNPPAAAPVPQIKLGPNGEIMLDETSLVIKQSDSNRLVSGIVREGAWARGAGRYSRAPRTAEWSNAETVRFYRALAALGTDFTLMAPLFPSRNRRDLKLKFKKEERHNGAQIDKALRSATAWDATRLLEEFQQERIEAKKKEEIAKKVLLEEKKAERERARVTRELRMKQSKGSKAIESTTKHFITDTNYTANNLVQRALDNKKRKPSLQLPPLHKLVPESHRPSHYATLTALNTAVAARQPTNNDMATISKIDPNAPPIPPNLPTNIETGSLVVLRVNDPASPTKTMLQTYIAHGAGKLTPVALPSTFLNSVVGYMKKGTPNSQSPSPSPASTNSNQDSRPCSTPGVIQVNPLVSPNKQQRHSPYNITPL